MNNDIKEILECMRKCTNLTPDYLDDLDYIEDYITNLEQEYEEADYDRHKLFEQKEKAIEYIKSHSNNLMFELRIEEMEDSLNILTGNAPTENLYRYTPEKGFELVGDEDV